MLGNENNTRWCKILHPLFFIQSHLSVFCVQRVGFYEAGMNVCLDSKEENWKLNVRKYGLSCCNPFSFYRQSDRRILQILWPYFERIGRIYFITSLLETICDISVHLNMQGDDNVCLAVETLHCIRTPVGEIIILTYIGKLWGSYI